MDKELVLFIIVLLSFIYSVIYANIHESELEELKDRVKELEYEQIHKEHK
jgi:hypothetical protein